MRKRFSTPQEALALGERIAAAREEEGLTQNQLSKKAKVERSLISKIENGHACSMNDSVQKLCTYLGIDGRAPPDLAEIQGRLARLALQWPQLITAISHLLDAVEAPKWSTKL